MKKSITALLAFFLFPTIALANPVLGSSKGGFTYSVIENTEETYTMIMPVAGFNSTMINATMKGNVLTIKGEPLNNEKKFVKKGYVPTKFSQSFTMALNSSVKDITIVSGVLSVNISVELKDNLKTKKIVVR